MVELLFRRDADNTPIGHAFGFDEPFLPAVDDGIVLAGQTLVVRRRRFTFDAQAGIQGVELYVAPTP